MTDPYQNPRWQRRRLHEMRRAGWACEWCADSESALHVHHWCYEGEPWEAPEGTLSVLCKACHGIAGEIRVLARRLLGRLLARPSAGLLDDIDAALNGLRHIEERGGSLAFLRWLEFSTLGWKMVERDLEIAGRRG